MREGLEQALHGRFTVESRDVRNPPTSSFTLHNVPGEAGTFWHLSAAYSPPRIANSTWGVGAKRCGRVEVGHATYLLS